LVAVANGVDGNVCGSFLIARSFFLIFFSTGIAFCCELHTGSIFVKTEFNSFFKNVQMAMDANFQKSAYKNPFFLCMFASYFQHLFRMTQKYLAFTTTFVLSLFLSICSAYAQTKTNLYASVNEKAMLHWVDSVFDRMSEEERIGQLFMPVIYPTTDSRNVNMLIRLIQEQKIGGILFQRGDPEAQVKVTNRAQREARVPLLIALDGEWGLSMRLNNTTRFPKNMMIGAVTDLDLIEQYGEEVGRQCREMGIHVNFAPTADVNSNPKNPVIGIRSFGENPEEVARRVIAYSRGLEKAGVMAVAKHFPGHGDTQTDSHHLLPTIHHDIERLHEVELYPFQQYINNGFSGIMTAHLNIPALGTNGRPSSLSDKVVTNLLRDRMGFDGLCFTDGLAMKGAVTQKNESLCVLALKAGNDILLGPVNLQKEVEAVKRAVRKKELKKVDIHKRCRKILCYKYIAGLHRVELLPTERLDERLNTPHADWINARLNAEAITVVKNENDILPLKQLNNKRIAALSLGGKTQNDFHQTLQQYGEVDCFNLPNNADAMERKSVFDQLKNYDRIICSIHHTQAKDSWELQNLASEKEVVFVFFTTPYQCADFRLSADMAQAIVVAYEPTRFAERFAAQSVFGGIAAKGWLSVEIPGLYAAQIGIHTEKTRLGFHEPEEVYLNPYVLQTIDSIVQEGLEQEAFPGCQVLVAKDGMIVYHKAFGYDTYEKKNKVTEQTTYDLASVSKATGTLLAVMRAYDEGHFQLTNKIADFVPELKHTDKKNIIIRDLLYHQSGLPGSISFFEQAIDKNSYTGSLYSSKKDKNHPVRHDARTYINTTFEYTPEVVSTQKKNGFGTEVARNFYVNDAFAHDSIVAGIVRAKRGAARYNYSCINFILLKMMVEEQMNMPMDKLLDDYFFKRLGATTTTYNPLRKLDSLQIAPSEHDRFVRRQVIRGYVHDEAAAFQGGVSGNAGLFSSAIDLAKISQLYLNDGTYGDERYLSTKTCKLFTGAKAPTSRRGLGFDKPDAKNPSHSPCTMLAPPDVYGHTGFTGTCFWIDPVNQLFYIFLTNRTFPSRINSKMFSLNIRSRIQETIYKAME
jgi:beta-glucosidase-like glycosyl hydrolase/CubicO group peptidase (beta-lactamase class C family)